MEIILMFYFSGYLPEKTVTNASTGAIVLVAVLLLVARKKRSRGHELKPTFL